MQQDVTVIHAIFNFGKFNVLNITCKREKKYTIIVSQEAGFDK